MFGLLGVDITSGTWRFTFGLFGLADGIEFGGVAMGWFAFAEIVRSLEHKEESTAFMSQVRGLIPTRADLAQLRKAISRDTCARSFCILSLGD